MNRSRRPLHVSANDSSHWYRVGALVSSALADVPLVEEFLLCEPRAAEVADRDGLLPLHLACAFQPDLTRLLLRVHPAGASHKCVCADG